jgi:ribose 5-phosphate isomerase B
MRIAIGSDHAGFVLKEQIKSGLLSEGHEVEDFGTSSPESCDYPDIAKPVAHAVADGKAERGILVCCTGIGMALAADKVEGVRAAPVENEDAARLTREHNDLNVLTLGAKYVDGEKAKRLVDIFLTTEFQGGRHARRVAKIAAIEQERPHK